MGTNYFNNRQKKRVEVISIDDTEGESCAPLSIGQTTKADRDGNSDIEIIEDIVKYNYEQKVKAKKKEILIKGKGRYSKDSGVYFEHYLGCIKADSIILSSELRDVKSDKDVIFCCEISPKSNKRTFASMYTLVLNNHYIASNDYIKICSKHMGNKKSPVKKAKKVSPKRKGSGGNTPTNVSSMDSVNSYIYEKYITPDKKFEESYKNKNDILKDIYNGGNACIRLKHNGRDICKFRNDLSRTISVLLILNAIRIEVEFDKILPEAFRMAGDLKTYVHVVLYPDAFNIDLHKFQEGSHALIKNSVIKLFEHLHMRPLREAKLTHEKTLTSVCNKYNKMEVTSHKGTPLKTVVIKSPTTKKSTSMSSGFLTPHKALGFNSPRSISDVSSINTEDDDEVIDISSDNESIEVEAQAEIITNDVFSEEKYRGGLLIEDFKEIHPSPEYFLPELKPYQAEGVWWMYLKENPPEYTLEKSNTAYVVKLGQQNKEILPFRVKSEILENETKRIDIKRNNEIFVADKKKDSKEIRNKPLNPDWAEYVFEPSLQIFENDKIKCVLRYFYVNKSNGVMSLCFPEYIPPFRGGILSDEMGLGKTIQSIGLIIHDIVDNNLHFKNDEEKNKTDEADLIESTIQGCTFKKGGTLVVAPLSLLFQWKEEIDRHTRKGFLSTYLYYAEEKCITSEELSKYSVVLTTYSTLSSEYTNHLMQEREQVSGKRKGKTEDENDSLSSYGQQKLNNFFMKTKLANFNTSGGNQLNMGSPIVNRDRYGIKKEKEGDGSGPVRNKSGAMKGGNTSSSRKSEMKEEASLFKIIWRRVMVDEAHVIKNKNTTQSAAAWKLRGERKWCITGTPIQNTMEDVFPLLRFIGVTPYGNFDWWNKEVAEYLKTKEKMSYAINVVREITSPLLLRRTKSSKGKDGKCIVTLPKKNIHVEQLQFTEEEKDFYQAVYYRSKTKFETYVSEGNVMSHYTHVLQLLLRLRQCCSHPLLLFSKPFFEEWNQEDGAQVAAGEYFGKKEKNPEDLEGTMKKENIAYTSNVAEKWRNTNLMIKPEKPENPENPENPESDIKIVNRSHNAILYRFLESSTASHKVDVNCLEEIENLKKKASTAECVICTEDAIAPLITKCMHIMCSKCAHSYFHLTRIAEKPCPLCGHYINLKSLKSLEKNVSPIDDLLKRMTKENFVYSTKLKRLLDYVKEDMKQETHVVVFSQWIGFLKIISKLFFLHNIPNRTYDGSLTFSERKEVLQWFNIQRGKIYNPGVGFVEPTEKIMVENFGGKVLLCSLKAGGVGLNLTVASKLYLMDLWWNPAIEDQAYQRVHRIGQLKDVHIYKFVIEKTVEKRILELHETKSTTANEILTQQGNVVESANSSLPQKLSVQNLIDMFKDYNR